MKTITMSEFFRSRRIIRSLHPGQSVIVTSKGRPEIAVTKSGVRKRWTAEELRAQARAMLSKPSGRKIDTVALLRKLRS